jgi:hypothetical protein
VLAPIVVILVTLPIVALALKPATTEAPGGDQPGTTFYPRITTRKVYQFIDIVLPASRVPGLVGAKAGSLVAAYCAGGVEHIAPVKLLPRRITRTFLVSANATVLMPELGEDKVLPDDVIVVSLPVPITSTEPMKASQQVPAIKVEPCTWSSYAAKSGVGYRVVVGLAKGVRVPTEEGPLALGQTVSFSIYFDYNRSPFKNEFSITDFADLERLGRLVGLKTPPTHGQDLARLEAEWSSFLKQLRSKLTQLLPPRSITVGPREAMQQPLSLESSATHTPEALASNTGGVGSGADGPSVQPLALIGGGGGASRYYHFSLIVANKTKVALAGRRVSVYMGYGVDRVVLYLRANSTSSTSGSGLQVTVRIVDVASETSPVVLWSYTYTYQLGSTPRDIYIYPTVSWSDKPLNITIEFKYSYGANPYITIATLNFYKVWSKMPTEQTRRAIQILSAGIARIRDPYNPDFLPPGCQQARASDMLSPSSYSPPLGFGGLVAPTSLKSVAIDSSMMNGLYYDEVTESSPVLYLDMCIYSRDQTTTGTITVKVDGVTYASKTITVSPPYSYAGFTIFLGSQPQKGHGPMITIEHNLPEGMELYVDAVVEYQYAPEVWKEDSLKTWFLKSSPWFKLLLYEYRGTYVGWESSMVMDSPIFSDVSNRYVVFKHRVSMEEGTGVSVKSVGIKVKPPVSPSSIACEVRHGKGSSLEKYVGAAATAWGLISTGLEVASLLGYTTPEPVSKGAVIAGFAITVLMSATESRVAKYENGYYTCTWSSGLSSYEWVEVEIYLNYNRINPKLGNHFSVSAMANDVWELKDQTVSIPYYPYSIVDPTVYEVYNSFYGRPPSEVIYG